MLVFCDTETTGLNRAGGYMSHCPINLSFLISDDDLNIKEIATIKSQPLSKNFWTVESEQVHNISYNKTMTYQEPMDACNEIIELFKRHDITRYNSIFIEHSLKFNGKIGFDLSFLLGMFMKQSKHFELYKYIDIDTSVSTVKMGKDAGYKVNKLDVWADRLGLTLDHHNSESDTKMCYEIFRHLGGLDGIRGSNGNFTGTQVRARKRDEKVLRLQSN